MLEHLLDPEFTDFADADVETVLEAQANTTRLIDFDAHSGKLSDIQRKRVQETFATVTNPDATPAEKKEALVSLRVPAAVRHLSGMLSEYDWDFVEQAKHLRGYVVAKLLEETRSPDPRIRLRALELTGKLTEVASFTERVEITKKEVSSSELEERIRARLAKMLPPVQEIENIETVVAVVHAATPIVKPEQPAP